MEAANGKPVLIYYGYRHDKERIQKRIPNATELKPRDFKAWNQGKIQVAIAHPASMGHGKPPAWWVNSDLVSLPWSLEQYQQANARLWRQGQKDTVVIFRILAQDTIDLDVAKALERKDFSQEKLMQAVKAKVRNV